MSRTVSGPVLVLVGPTATGKSHLAIEVARRGVAGRPVEVVAADAFTLYRGMDIGTAKPEPEIRAEIPHHLIDALDPWEDADVAWFQRAARSAVAAIAARGAVPLLVGGSGLYVRAVIDDLRFPPTDAELRSRLRGRYRDDPRGAHAALAAVDPAAAAKIDPGNVRRSVRALEVIELTGAPFSQYADEWERYRSIYPDLRMWGLDLPTEALRARIRERAARMVGAGLVEEARRLAELPQPLSRSARQAIGYREALAVLGGELEHAELAAAIAQRTWRFAKRQRAWFRRDPRVEWSTPDVLVAVIQESSGGHAT